MDTNREVPTYAAAMTGLDRERDDGDDCVDAWRALLLAHAAAVRAIERDMERSGMRLTWYDVLLELNAAEGRRLRMQELSDRVVLSRTRVSRLVDEMAAEGLVTKQPDDRDRRSTWASITPEGRAALKRTAPSYLDGIRRHFTRYLTPAEQRAVTGALMKVVDAHATKPPVRRTSAEQR